MKDRLGRDIDYMRISITDRCNLRCSYCMPEGGADKVLMADILSYDEIVKLAIVAANLGISKLRITGGEPLVRDNVPELVSRLYEIDGINEVNLTTNGVLLKDNLPALVKAGLKGVNISLDTMNRDRYKEITGRDYFDAVMDGIKAATDTPLNVKINTVLQDADSYKEMLTLAKEMPLSVRFIELMPLGCASRMSGPSFYDVMDYIRDNYSGISECDSVLGNGPSRYINVEGFKGKVGFISPIHGVFCDSCNRIRLGATGYIKPCLCYGKSLDVRTPLRNGDMDGVRRVLTESIMIKPDRHSFSNLLEVTEHRGMVSIGG